MKEQLSKKMEQQARCYFSLEEKYETRREILIFLIIFSLLNIGLYYIRLIPVINKLLELIGEGDDLAPAAFLTRRLFLWQMEKGQWLLAVGLVLLSLLPFFLSLLITGNKPYQRLINRDCLNKNIKSVAWGFLPAVVWYFADTVIYICYGVSILIDDFSFVILFFILLNACLRLGFAGLLAEGMCLPKEINETWNGLVGTMFLYSCYENGVEKTKVMSTTEVTHMIYDYLAKIR